MPKMRPLVFSFVALLAAPAAQALTDHEHLAKWCTAASSVAAGRCIGYLLAAEDALSADSVEGARACLPRDTGLQQQHKIVIDWLEVNPGAASGTALGPVARAYAQHFPCSQ